VGLPITESVSEQITIGKLALRGHRDQEFLTARGTEDLNGSAGAETRCECLQWVDPPHSGLRARTAAFGALETVGAASTTAAAAVTPRDGQPRSSRIYRRAQDQPLGWCRRRWCRSPQDQPRLLWWWRRRCVAAIDEIARCAHWWTLGRGCRGWGWRSTRRRFATTASTPRYFRS
jgi:hypothetical protein